MIEFRGYARRQVATTDIKTGDFMYFVGAGMPCPVVGVGIRGIQGELLHITVAYESFGRSRRGVIERRTGGKSTIHVPLARAS